MASGNFMKRMGRGLETAGKFVQRFGLFRGLLAYLKIGFWKRFGKKGDYIRLNLPYSSEPVLLRAKTADGHAFWQVFIGGDYDLPYDFDPSVIVDAGAHVGYASIYFSHHFPKARLVAIEPEASNGVVLRENLAGKDKVIIKSAAVWSENTKLNIRNPDADSWSFRVEQNQDDDGEVPTVTITDLLDEMGHIDILKLDIEGAEKELFSKDTKWLNDVRMLIIELHEHYAPGCTQLINEVMKKHGFELLLEKGENVVFQKA